MQNFKKSGLIEVGQKSITKFYPGNQTITHRGNKLNKSI